MCCWQHVASRVFFPPFCDTQIYIKKPKKKFLKFPNILVKNLRKKKFIWKKKHYKFVNTHTHIYISISVLNMSNPNAHSNLRGWQKKTSLTQFANWWSWFMLFFKNNNENLFAFFTRTSKTKFNSFRLGKKNTHILSPCH